MLDEVGPGEEAVEIPSRETFFFASGTAVTPFFTLFCSVHHSTLPLHSPVLDLLVDMGSSGFLWPRKGFPPPVFLLGRRVLRGVVFLTWEVGGLGLACV